MVKFRTDRACYSTVGTVRERQMADLARVERLVENGATGWSELH